MSIKTQLLPHFVLKRNDFFKSHYRGELEYERISIQLNLGCYTQNYGAGVALKPVRDTPKQIATFSIDRYFHIKIDRKMIVIALFKLNTS